MTLLDHYLRAVKIYLPKGPEGNDILSELSELLQTKLEERESELGRPLTEVEQEEVLAQHGNPTLVASRYGATGHGLAFGRQLIGPELFPLYRAILLAQFSCTIVVVFGIALLSERGELRLMRFLGPMLFQFILSTAIFTSIDAFRRRERARESWTFPPTYLQSIPRWQSAAGLACLSLTAVWWAALPYAPALILGSATDRLALAPAWNLVYWPLLLALVIGMTQRLANLLHPEWNWLQPVTRLVTNGIGVVMLFPFLRSQPYVTPLVASAEALARGVNASIWWNALASFGLYWLINCGFMVWMCVQHVRYVMRRRRLELLT